MCACGSCAGQVCVKRLESSSECPQDRVSRSISRSVQSMAYIIYNVEWPKLTRHSREVTRTNWQSHAKTYALTVPKSSAKSIANVCAVAVKRRR